MTSKKSDRPQNALRTGAELLGLGDGSPELKEAGKQLAQTVQTVTTLVNVVLLPIAAVNFGYRKAKEYFENEFQNDLEPYTKQIPPDRIVEPSPSIAAPILQGLAFSHEENELKEMYLNLLAMAMHEEQANHVHPAFVEIIRQLTPREAQVLKGIIRPPVDLPIVILRTEEGEGHIERFRNVVNFQDFENEKDIILAASMIDNWVRLGLFSIDYLSWFTEDDLYSWVDTHLGYALTKQRFGDNIDVGKGILRPTDFGRLFATAAI